jgi:transposase
LVGRAYRLQYRSPAGYLTVVTDHATGRVVWVAEGRSRAVLEGFLEEIGPETCAAIEILTMDVPAACGKGVQEAVLDAQIAHDHFHIAQLPHEAPHAVRCGLVRDAGNADPEGAGAIKNMHWPTLHRADSVPEWHLDIRRSDRPRRGA